MLFFQDRSLTHRPKGHLCGRVFRHSIPQLPHGSAAVLRKPAIADALQQLLNTPAHRTGLLNELII